MDVLDSFSDFQFFQVFKNRSKCTSYNWYHHHPYAPKFLKFSGKIQVLLFFSFEGFSHDLISNSLCCIVIKHNERTKHFFIKKYISHFILERGPQFVVSLRDRLGDIYSKRRFLLVPYLLPGARGTNTCTRLPSVSSETTLTPQIGCVSLARLSILWTQSKSNRVSLISRGLLPVTHLPDQPTPTHCHPPVY